MGKQFQYLKIKEYIVSNIQNHYYPDDKIESENELARKFGVTRMTVRQALSALIQEGIIYTVPKRGAYVQRKMSFKELGGLQSFSEDAAHLEGQISTRAILCQKERSTNETLKELGMLNSKQQVWHVLRVRYLDNKPISYEDSYYNIKFVEDIPMTALENSLYAYFEQDLKLDIDFSHQQIDACLASEFAKELEIKESAPLLRILQTTYLTNQECLEYSYTYYRVDRYSFHQDAYRKKGNQ